MRRFREIAGLAFLSALAAAPAAWAQAPLHDSQYAEADIAYGATVYAAQCVDLPRRRKATRSAA